MERFSIDLTRQRMQELVRQIRKGESVMVFRQSKGVVHHRVTIGENTAIVVYDKNRGTVVTLMHEESDPRRPPGWGRDPNVEEGCGGPSQR